MRKAKNHRFMGKSDWRIPTKSEFEEVIGRYDDCQKNSHNNGDYAASKDIAHSVHSTGAPGTYWASSSYVGDSNDALFFHFGNGYVGNLNREGKRLVRLVRASQSSDGKAALEFNNEYKRVLAYDRAQAAQARAQQAQEIRDAQARQANAVAACKDKYVGQRVYMGKAIFNLDVFGEVLGVGNTRMTVKVLHPSGSRDVQEVNCSDY